MATIIVKSRSKSIKDGEYDSIESFEQFVSQVSSKNKGITKNRLRITTKSADSKTSAVVKSYDALISSDVVYVKDIGPQISWRTVFLIEYFGPILIHYTIFKLAGEPEQYKLLFQMNAIHYLKREFESIFIHTFSNSTMPLFNVFKNSAHYWLLGGSVSAAYLNIGNFDIPNWSPVGKEQYLFWAWAAFEFFNAVSHIQLRLLGDKTVRKGKPRQPPSGGFFEIFISPNYTFEIFGWFTVFLLRPNVFTLIFLIVGAVQMNIWAQDKNKKFGTKKSFLIPFIF